MQREKEFKTKMIKNHIGQCSSKLRQTTGLLEFSIEVMKEQDAAAFLMVNNYAYSVSHKNVILENIT